MGSREKMFHVNLSWRRAPRSGSVASLNLVSEADTVFVSFLFWAPTTTTMTSLSRAQTENVFLGSSYIGRHENNVDDVETSVRARNDEVQVTTGSVCLCVPSFLSFCLLALSHLASSDYVRSFFPFSLSLSLSLLASSDYVFFCSLVLWSRLSHSSLLIIWSCFMSDCGQWIHFFFPFNLSLSHFFRLDKIQCLILIVCLLPQVSHFIFLLFNCVLIKGTQ